MAHLRTFKINDVNDSSEHTLNQKRITLYNNTKNIANKFSNTNNNCNVKVTNKGVIYSPPVNITGLSCLASAKNYDILLDVTKGKYLHYYSCMSGNDVSYSLTGNINDANLLIVDSNTTTTTTLYSGRGNSSDICKNMIDLSNQVVDTIYSLPGVGLVQDYSYNCQEGIFNMEEMQESIEEIQESIEETPDMIQNNRTYYNRLARQDKYNGFYYPSKFRI
jgi:hypothetical protein